MTPSPTAYAGKQHAGRQDLQNADFRGRDLRGANFRGADCTGADFTEAQLHSANFSGATLVGANFSGCRTGLQKRWLAVQLAVLFFASALMGIASFFPGWLVVAFTYESLNVKNAGLAAPMAGLAIALIATS